MADISLYIKEIQDAIYGEEVRTSIINALNKVNDDNNSYIAIKNEINNDRNIVEKYMLAFDEKITTADTTADKLLQLVTNANKVFGSLTDSIDTANTLNTAIIKSTDSANTAKIAVDQAVNNANKELVKANGIIKAIEDANILATNAKNDLTLVINSAKDINNILTRTKTDAGVLKTALENVIKTANTSKSNLQGVIDTVPEKVKELNDVILKATETLNILSDANTAAKLTLQSLESENTAAKANIKDLRSENFNSQEILAGVTDIRAYLGMIEGADIVGLSVDYQNKAFERLASAKGLNQGADFDKFTMYGGRKRCTVDDDGNITSWYGDPNYVEDGSIGQVMVYQPKFYYMTCPVVYEPIETGIGYHLRKANYYVSDKPHAGFRVHPVFRDALGHEVDYILESAYEGSLYDNSAKAYLKEDEQVGDFTPKSGDKLSSVAGVKPASGNSQNFTRPTVEITAQNRGTEWHGDIINVESADELLMIIEAGMMNTQTAYGQGVTQLSDVSGENCAVITGGTTVCGNASGKADGVDGQVSISWRGKENPYGNIWKFVYGVNMFGNGSMGGGQPYICNNFNFAESKNTDNYEPAGFTVANKSGYVSAMGYSTHHDYLFMASETDGNSSLPVGDYTYVTENLNGYRIARLGGSWNDWSYAGAFYWSLNSGVGSRYRHFGSRLVYVPVFDSLAHNNAVASWKAKMAA